MITFTYNAVTRKNFIEVKVDENETMPATMIKTVEDADNETILKACQDWLDAMGLSDREYRVNVQLH